MDARRAYDMWLALIQDEDLYEATLNGRHAELAAARSFGPDDIKILDGFHAQRGLSWNIENLRFRAALHVTGNLLLLMQRTILLLTKGNDDWTQELVFEYLSHHHWQELGHEHLQEAERFGAYVRKRVLKRRIPPPHIDAVLDFELALVRHLRTVKSIAAEEWPERREPTDEELAIARPRLAKSSTLVELPVDMTDWIRSADPRMGEVREGAITVLVSVPSPREPQKFTKLSPAVLMVLEKCTGELTLPEMAEALSEDFDADDVYGLVSKWISEGVLVAS